VAAGWLATLGPAPCRADLVRFAAGGEVDLPARWEGPTLVLDAPSGPIRFPRDEIRAIEPQPWPGALWPARRDAARRGGADDRFAAALWAIDQGLTDEGRADFAALHREEPSHPGAARVVRMLGALDAEPPEPDLNRLRVLGPERFRVASGRHVVLLHQHPEAEAAERLALLERVVTTFYATFAARGIVLRVPSRKLVTVWFAEQADYQGYLRADGAGGFLDTHGYYHPTRRIVVAHDERSREPLRGRLRALEAARAAGSSSEARRRDLDRRALLLDLDGRERDVGIAAHELVHLLVAESGLAPRFEDFPIWLHEGLAMQFEGVRGGRWAGVGGDNAQRMRLWKALPCTPPLVPLLRDEGFGRGYRAHRYAAAWGLVFDAWNERPEEWVTFLDLLRTPAEATASRPERTLAAFRAAFGEDLTAYEAAWHERMARRVRSRLQ
jgi:hypothetical protein